MLHKYAKTLVHEGFVIVPPHIHNIPVHLIEEAAEAGEHLIRFWSQLDCQRSLCREGEDDPDFGLIDTRDVPGKDLKFFLHIAFDLREMIAKVPDLFATLQPYHGDITILLKLHRLINLFNVQLFTEISQMLPEIVGLERAVSDFKQSYIRSVPDSTTVLRVLLYPNMPKQVGAQAHFDIDFMTSHLGDKGGSLRAHKTLGSDEGENVSPPHGSILVFPGLKAFVISGGKLVPLYHSAKSDPGEDRQAFVQFSHVPCSYVNSGDGKNYGHVFDHLQISDPTSWYEKFWRK